MKHVQLRQRGDPLADQPRLAAAAHVRRALPAGLPERAAGRALLGSVAMQAGEALRASAMPFGAADMWGGVHTFIVSRRVAAATIAL